MDVQKSIHGAIKDVVSLMNNGKMINLPGLLELLNSSADVDAQVKLLSILSAYLMVDHTSVETIVTYNTVYDKICKILANCPPRKITIALNFLSALLYVNDEDNQRKVSLTAYAKNMMRTSGCLATMCDLFTSSMMHQEAWRALCRCLAEACRGIEANQTYCSHLVLICVRQCSLRNIEVFLVLQGLLHNHSPNVKLFVESNGISLFHRELLQHDMCLQLLATIAQSSTEAVALVVNTDICQQLRDFLQLYGPQSQLGQWATIVLYHASKAEAHREHTTNKKNMMENKINDSMLSSLHIVNQKRETECSADTTKFFQNIMKEIVLCGAQKEFSDLKTFFPTDVINGKSRTNSLNRFPTVPFHDILQRKRVSQLFQNPKTPINVSRVIIPNDRADCNKTRELSFSFLRNQHLNKKHCKSNYITADYIPEIFKRTLQARDNKARQDSVYDYNTEYNETHQTLRTDDFKPNFASTPKNNGLEYSGGEKQRGRNTPDRRPIQNSIKHNQIKRREKNRTAKYLERTKIDKEIKYRSLSGRFFDAINTSCTTLVKTVKNIFRPKSDLLEIEDDSSDKTSDPEKNSSCSYSFTNYMRKRDDLLKTDDTNESCAALGNISPKENSNEFSLDMTNSCYTCNNTITLRRKFASDSHLKQTIRKLKLGINLYGCDFKKISRAMWPKESYMTPAVLYNLYRKLIIK